MTRLRGLLAGFWLRSLLVLAIGWFYLWTAVPERRASMSGPTGNGYYNLLMKGFLKGTLSLDLAADPFLAQIANPSDPSQRGDHGLHDASYYRGRYYLYFGAAPVFLLFLPFHLISGRFIDESLAAMVFAFAGLVASVALVLAIRRRYFRRASGFAAAGCVLALGLADMVPILLRRSNVWEVPITCAYACLTAGFCLLFEALHQKRRVLWLGLASAAFGLAVASRPTYLFGCAAVLVPVAAFAWERRMAVPSAGDTSLPRLAAAAILPLAATGILLALYNLGRFANPFDFGFRHLMNGEPVWKEDLFGLRFFWYNFRVYAMAPARWSPYFPFVSVARLPDAPSGHLGSEDPFGIIPNIPFVMLAAVALVFCGRKSAWPPRLRWMCLAIALAVVGTGLATSSFGGAINRYEVDFVPGIIVLACIGWLGVADMRMRRPGRILANALICAALAYSVLFNLLASVRHNELFKAEHPQMYSRMAHRWDTVPHWLDRWTGVNYGPLEIKVVFPANAVGETQPLVVTGFSFLSDYLVVHYDAPGRVSFALQHSGYGYFTGPSMAAAPGSVHTLKIEMGSLYPPVSHPFFDSLTPQEAALCQKTLSVSLDGTVALQRDLPFFDAASHHPDIGKSGDRPGYRKPFSGHIESVRQLPIDLIDAPQGPLRLSVLLPPFTGARNEPLLSTGTPGFGDLIYIRYDGPDRVSVGLDHWGHGSKISSPIPVDYSVPHKIDIDSESLAKPDGPVGTERTGRFILRLDGKTIFCEQAPYCASALETTATGINEVGSSACTGMFRGQLFVTRGSLPGAQPGPEETYGGIDLDFRMGASVVQAQPIVTTGKRGAGDALSIRWVGPGRARLDYDHWGAGLMESDEFAMAPDSEHVMRIELPSLAGPGSTPEERICRQNLVAFLDGNLVWARRVPFNPALANEAYVGSNSIGASTCDRDFAEGVVWFERHPQAPMRAHARGTLVLRLVLPAGRTGSSEPLLVFGVPGRADVIAIRYVDERHVSFALDHWGATFSVSQPVQVDYRRPHDIEIEMPNLESSGSGSEITANARVRLDGVEVWETRQRFYQTSAEPAVAANTIGASTCEPEFSGELLGVGR